MQFFKQLRPSKLETRSIVTLYFLYMGAFTLIPILDTDSAIQARFTKFYGSLFQLAITWPAAAAILGALKALSQQLGVSLPPDSL